MNNLKAIVIISSKLVIGMYRTRVYHFPAPLLHMDRIILKKEPNMKCVQEYYCFIKTVVSNFSVIEEMFDKYV